jgi:hypothetical protein
MLLLTCTYTLILPFDWHLAADGSFCFKRCWSFVVSGIVAWWCFLSSHHQLNWGILRFETLIYRLAHKQNLTRSCPLLNLISVYNRR